MLFSRADPGADSKGQESALPPNRVIRVMPSVQVGQASRALRQMWRDSSGAALLFSCRTLEGVVRPLVRAPPDQTVDAPLTASAAAGRTD